MEKYKQKQHNKHINQLLLFLIGIASFLVVLFLLFPSPMQQITASITAQLPNNNYCTRTQPYPMPPEFQRAMSLITERVSQARPALQLDQKKVIRNCLDIQYADLSQQSAEGEFLFDQNSSQNDLKIYVNTSYHEYDDYLTAILLSHEITHAGQFVFQKYEGQRLSCYDKEIQAFDVEQAFIRTLNEEEKTSIFQKILTNPTKNTAYESIYQLMQIMNQAFQECGTLEGSCDADSVHNQITAMVENSPFYQQECANDPTPSNDQMQ